LVERYTSRGASTAWRAHWWQVACFSLVLGDTEDRNDFSVQWSNEWALDSWVDCPILTRLRESFLPILANNHAENPDPDNDDLLIESLLPEHMRHDNALPYAPPPQERCNYIILLA
jgi:hypothetical protein